MATYSQYRKMLKLYPDVLAIKDIQMILGIGKNLTYKLINENVIRHIRVGKKILVTKVDLIHYLRENSS